jgi:type IV pilus assembly protein PilE
MNRGFTLIELMIVLGIVAIIAAVAIPLYGGYKERVYRAEAQEELMNLSSVQEDYFNSYRKYSSSSAELESFYGISITGDHFKITIVTANSDTTYTATANVCYAGNGASCTSGNKDAVCTISNGQDKAVCTY